MALRIQRPSQQGNWLFQEQDDKKRIFRDLVYLGITATEWAECTNEEKEAWEEEHKPIDPETPENENKEDVQ